MEQAKSARRLFIHRHHHHPLHHCHHPHHYHCHQHHLRHCYLNIVTAIMIIAIIAIITVFFMFYSGKWWKVRLSEPLLLIFWVIYDIFVLFVCLFVALISSTSSSALGGEECNAEQAILVASLSSDQSTLLHSFAFHYFTIALQFFTIVLL